MVQCANNNNKIPVALNKYNPILIENKLTLSYDKNKTKLKQIINILNHNNILFNEINTYEGDLEDVFMELIKK